MRRVIPSPNPVELPEPLHKVLTSYALAAGAASVSALALVAPADAQIVYTPAHVVLNRNQRIFIDLNNDGIVDTVVFGAPGVPDGRSVKATPAGPGRDAKILQGQQGSWAAAVGYGKPIGPSDRFLPGEGLMERVSSYGSFYSGSWPYHKTAYLGIQFEIEGETHYGWARLSVKPVNFAKNVRVYLAGYAYEMQPNQPIRAGDTGEDTGENGAALEPSSQMAAPSEPDAQKLTLGRLALGSAR